MIDRPATDPMLSKLDPHEWKTGDEPMTAAQRSYLETLSREAGEEFDPDIQLTKADAALRIEDLQARTGRGGGAKTRQPKAPSGEGSQPPRTSYRDRPTDDGMHGDGGMNPSGVGDEDRRDAPRRT